MSVEWKGWSIKFANPYKGRPGCPICGKPVLASEHIVGHKPVGQDTTMYHWDCWMQAHPISETTG